jgi:solute carrier family 6 dopamine transporter-like protein 3
VLLIYSWIDYAPLTKADYVFPAWANGVGWTIAMSAILAVPAVAIVTIVLKAWQNREQGFRKER